MIIWAYILYVPFVNRAPQFTDLIAFTDEPEPEDQELLESTVIGLAQDKRCKINIIWTGSLWVYAGNLNL